MAVETAEPRPSQIAQWSAIAATVLVSFVLAVVLPRVADRSRPQAEALAAGTPVEYGGVSMIPAEGWTKTDNPTALILAKQGIELLVFPPSPDSETSPSDSVTDVLKTFTDDPASTAEVGEVKTLTTDGGLDAAWAAVTDGDSVIVSGAFSDGSNLAIANIQLTASQWDEMQREIVAMIRSVSFTGEVPS
jgi:hypothetical protein